MRAVVTTADGLEATIVSDPTPGSGHVLVRTLACGICGSDLHAAQDLRHFAELTTQAGAPGAFDPDQGFVFGHEYCAEVVDHGPDTARTLTPGTLVCSIPVLLAATGPEMIGYSNLYPGGFAEQMILQEQFLLPVPEGLPARVAALTEPLAVGEHAVNLASIAPGDLCLVIGAGPVGLAVIAALKAKGHGPVIAADFSPTRRRLAEAMGADSVVDPTERSPYHGWSELGVPSTTMERSALDMFGGDLREVVIFEAVGVPGVLQSIIAGAPPKAQIIVVGVCMRTDQIEPFTAVTKELQMRFSFGYTPEEFAATLERLSAGRVPTDELVTGMIGLDEVPDAFEALRNPGQHGKVLVRY